QAPGRDGAQAPDLDSRRALVATELSATGVVCRRFAGADEFGTLLRVVGPMCGYLAGLIFVREVAQELGRVPDCLRFDLEVIVAAVEGARPAMESMMPLATAALAPERSIALLSCGGYGEIVSNLADKLLEGLLRPEPQVWDVLQFAH